MKFSASWALIALGLSLSSAAQQVSVANAADEAVLDAHRAEIAAATPIYGYDLAQGNWTIRQLPCAVMPNFVVFRYARRFPGGVESLFTVLVPLGSGSIHIVPVLRADRTPFTPAPKDPRNIALFNQFASMTAVRRDLASSKWFDPAACYAYMTGAASLAVSHGPAGSLAAPLPVLHLDGDRAAAIAFADHGGRGAYRFWRLQFDGPGRMTAASIQDHAASAAIERTATQAATRPKSSAPQPVDASSRSESAAVSGVETQAGNEGGGQKRKFLPNPPQPPVRFIPDGPPAKAVPDSSN